MKSNIWEKILVWRKSSYAPLPVALKKAFLKMLNRPLQKSHLNVKAKRIAAIYKQIKDPFGKLWKKSLEKLIHPGIINKRKTRHI